MNTLLKVENPSGETDLGKLPIESAFNFSLAEGQVLSFLEGKNPTLLFRLILNLGRLTGGTIEFPLVSKDVPFKIYTYLGLAPREKGLLSNLTILENAVLPAQYHNITFETESAEDLAKKYLNELGVGNKYWDLRPDHVSWEVRKKTLLARSIVCDPKIIILEDPSNMLSWGKLPELYAWIKKQKSLRRAILICSENIPFALSVCDLVWNHENKEIVAVDDYLKAKGNEWQFLISHIENQMRSGLHAT